MTDILVTGALGNIGSSVVDVLGDDRVTVAGRSVDRLRRIFGPSIRAVELDFGDESTFGAALEGIDRVFLMRPPAIARVGPTLNRFIDLAADAGVGQIVFSSVAGADTNPIVPHHRVERHLIESGIGWTILRPGFFAQNLETAYREDIIEDDRIHVPAGDAHVAFVDTRDIGSGAATTLTEGGHLGRSYHLTGAEAMTFGEVASILSDSLGRAITYEPASILGYLAHLTGRRLPLAKALVQTVLHTDLRRGTAATVSPDLERLLGKPPTPIRRYIEDRARLWAR